MAMSLGAATGTWTTRCGCSIITPLRCSPPMRKSVGVVADARKTSQGRMTKKNNAVDVNAASLNSTLHDVEGPRVSNGNVLRDEEPEVVEEKNMPKMSLQEILMQKLKLDQALDEILGFMAPREKGDIRDVILMSFSFAVLVYISQRLVCLYCVVRHMYSF